MSDSSRLQNVLLRLVVSPSGCIEWPGAKTPGGYGVVRMAQRNYYVHRLAYEHFHGDIPEGFQIDHLCRNRACANPDHLEAVTQKVNLLRGEGFPARNAAKTHCYRGHPLEGDNLYVRLDGGGRMCRTCYRERKRERTARIRAASYVPPPG